MNPSQLFHGLVRSDHFGDMLFNYLIKFTITVKSICFKLYLLIHPMLYHLVDGLRSKVRHKSHFEEFERRRLTMIFWIPDILPLRHNKCRSLVFATTPRLVLLTFLAHRGRFNGGKVDFIHFCKSGEFMPFIPCSHSNPDLMCHKPNWFILLEIKLSLHFLRRNAFIGGGHWVLGNKATSEGNIRRFQNCPTSNVFCVRQSLQWNC